MFFNCKTLQAVLISFILPFCDVDNYIIKELFNFSHQPKRKQALLKSNLPAIGWYLYDNKEQSGMAAFPLLSVSPMA